MAGKLWHGAPPRLRDPYPNVATTRNSRARPLGAARRAQRDTDTREASRATPCPCGAKTPEQKSEWKARTTSGSQWRVSSKAQGREPEAEGRAPAGDLSRARRTVHHPTTYQSHTPCMEAGTSTDQQKSHVPHSGKLPLMLDRRQTTQSIPPLAIRKVPHSQPHRHTVATSR